ncbi:hypothetical protein TELCIR_19862, partial [Teladorsagia circumcincta]
MLELFDYIRSEDIKPLVKYTVENHMSSFEDVTYVKLFSELKIRYEQQRDRENSAKITADERVPSPAAFAKERQSLVDYDESDSDEDENSGPNDSIPSSSTGSPVQMSSSIEKGAESTTAAPATSSGGDLSPCDDDVSSTSGEEESAA